MGIFALQADGSQHIFFIWVYILDITKIIISILSSLNYFIFHVASYALRLLTRAKTYPYHLLVISSSFQETSDKIAQKTKLKSLKVEKEDERRVDLLEYLPACKQLAIERVESKRCSMTDKTKQHRQTKQAAVQPCNRCFCSLLHWSLRFCRARVRSRWKACYQSQ